MDDRLGRVIRQQLREAGRQFEEAKRAYSEAQESTADSDTGAEANESSSFDLPTNDDGNARIVCRRYAEKRAVAVAGDGRPACFDPTHPDCEGCAEDVRQGVVETWQG
ncbi:DUF7091 family protein [Haloparvum sp. PAK95]|uniref:DUF7091 family protein n=1 Tax=Haloparvum sp. PAK95 TaxID=3418962 RepID=UPI003D2F218E